MILCITSSSYAFNWWGSGGGTTSAAIDDSKGNGDTTYTWSADKIYDQLALKQAALSLVKGTYTNTYLCKYTASGTLLDCNVDPATFQAALTYPVTGVVSPTAGYLTKWGASENAIVDGPKLGTLTDAKWCSYSTANGLQCTETAPQAADAELTAIAGLTFADASIIQLTGAAAGAVLTSGGNNYILGSTSDNSALEFKTPEAVRVAIGALGLSGSMTDEQLLCGENTDGTTKAKSCGAKTTDNSTASNSIIKDASGYVANATYVIDAHAASTTITLIPGSCPIIHNASQADSNIDNTLPAVGAGKCFVALATSAEADKYWRLTAAAANTICLNRTCGKDYIQFDTPAVGDVFSCMSDGTNWYCYDYDSSAAVGDL